MSPLRLFPGVPRVTPFPYHRARKLIEPCPAEAWHALAGIEKEAQSVGREILGNEELGRPLLHRLTAEDNRNSGPTGHQAACQKVAPRRFVVEAQQDEPVSRMPVNHRPWEIASRRVDHRLAGHVTRLKPGKQLVDRRNLHLWVLIAHDG